MSIQKTSHSTTNPPNSVNNTQGFLPIAGFNYGAQKYQRVKESINTAILYACGLGLLVFGGIMFFAEEIVIFLCFYV